LAIKPDDVHAQVNLALVLERQGKLDEAIPVYERALELDPGCAEAHFNHGLALLLTGNLAEGWKEYEWGFQCGSRPQPRHAQPRWAGESLAGKTILLCEEQGLGDSLQFVRYAELLKQRGAQVIVECRRELASLVASAPGVAAVVRPGESPGAFDVWLPLLSVPGVVGTTMDTIPASVPYLFPNAELVAKWKSELADTPGLKVGISWQGNPQVKTDRNRSIPLEHFARLGEVSGVQFFSFQMGVGREQVAGMHGRLPIIDLADRIGNLEDTAAIMRNLDLVILSDSAPAHLAGALGVNAWVALGFAPDWRWLRERSDSPWYPTMRLYRQPRPGDWSDVFQRIAADLATLRK
jgi:hypothetical protein